VAFDVVETLISLEPLRRRFVEIGMHASTLERWFDRMLRDGMALTLAGDYAPFPEVARAALRVIGGGRLSDDDVSHVLDRLRHPARATGRGAGHAGAHRTGNR
jgi:2-haloacid dehalogenase